MSSGLVVTRLDAQDILCATLQVCKLAMPVRMW